MSAFLHVVLAQLAIIIITNIIIFIIKYYGVRKNEKVEKIPEKEPVKDPLKNKPPEGYDSVIKDLQNNFFNLNDIKTSLDSLRENEATEKEPIKIKTINSPEFQKAIVSYYTVKGEYVETPEVIIKDKELIIKYKLCERRIKFSKEISKYFFISEKNLKSTIYTLYLNKRIVSISELFDSKEEKKKWEKQMLDLQIKDLRKESLDDFLQ